MTQPTKNEIREYNGWANYETWNVALWIGNDEGLYSLAKDFRSVRNPYKAFVECLKECSEGSEIALQTPDGVAWNDSSLDINELNSMIEEL